MLNANDLREMTKRYANGINNADDAYAEIICNAVREITRGRRCINWSFIQCDYTDEVIQKLEENGFTVHERAGLYGIEYCISWGKV